MATIVVSGTVRVTNTSNVYSRTFSAAVTVSQFVTQDILLANGASNVVFSLTNMSNPGFMMLLGETSLVRVNYSDLASMVSAGSAGHQFRNLFCQIGSGASGPIGLHFANSSGDSNIVTLIVGM